MSHKVIFRVHGWGELNGRFRINIEKEMDSHLAQRIKSKQNLIKFVEQEYPGIKITPNSLGYRINHIKKTNATNSKKKTISNNRVDESKNEISIKNNDSIISLFFEILKFTFKNIWKLLRWMSRD